MLNDEKNLDPRGRGSFVAIESYFAENEKLPERSDLAVVPAVARLAALRARRIGLVGLVPANHTAGNCPDLAMASVVPGYAANDRSLDAALGFGSHGGQRQGDNGGGECKTFHGDFLRIVR